MHVGPRLALGRYAVQRARRFAVDQDDALVAGADLGQVTLDDDRLAAEVGQHFEQRAQILVAGSEVEHPGAAIAVQRLDDDVAVLGAELADQFAVRGYESRRREPLEVVDEKFLRRVAHVHRVVDHQCPRVDVLQEMGRGDVGHIERRILTHQNHVQAGQVEPFGRPERKVITRLAADRERAHPGDHPAVAERQVARQIMEHAVAPALRLQGQRKARVGIDVDALEGVHLNGDIEAHAGLAIGVPARLSPGARS